MNDLDRCCAHSASAHASQKPYSYSSSPEFTVSVSAFYICWACHDDFYARLSSARWWNPLTWGPLFTMDASLPYRHKFDAPR